MVGCCECGIEPSSCIKCGGFLDWLRACQLLRKDSAPCSLVLYEIIIIIRYNSANTRAELHTAFVASACILIVSTVFVELLEIIL